MAVTTIAASAGDAEIDSTSTVYSTARAGTGAKSLATGFPLSVGQFLLSGTYFVQEYLVSYDISGVPSPGSLVSAHLSLVPDGSAGSWTLSARENDFGATVTTADFVAGAGLGALTRVAQASITATPPPLIVAGSTELLTRLGSAGPVRLLWHSEATLTGTAPAGDDSLDFFAADSDDGAPTLVVETVPDGAQLRHAAATTQLSTGDTVYAIATAAAVTVTVVTSTGSSTLGTATVGTGDTDFADVPALQSLALVRDDSDNVYLVGVQGSAPTTALLVKAYVKSGATWTAKTALHVQVPSYPGGRINNIAAGWHDTSDDGHLMVVASHNAGTGKTGQIVSTPLDCTFILAGSGSFLPVSGGADPVWLPIAAASGPAAYTNETGSSLDIATVGLSGAVYTIDAPDKTIAGVYTLTTAGAVDLAKSVGFGSDSVQIAHDADAKVRVIAVDSARVAFAAAGTITVRSTAGTILGQADLTAQGLDTFPTAAVLRSTAAWDVVYDPASNKIWHYYADATDDTKVKRTGFSLSTYQGSGEETAVTTYTAAVVGMSAPRVVTDERRAVLRLSGDGEDTVVDSFNVAPNPPTLTTRTSFDATKAATFVWVPSDDNSLDTQSAYELVINDASGASAYDSGKVTSTVSSHSLPADTLTNDKSWQWKVRTWDAAGASGTYSAVGTFTTTSAGTVTITSPTADNATLKSASVNVTWSVSGTTQASYRVKVVVTSTGSTFSDTGDVASTATTATVTGLASDVEYRVEVTVKDSSGIASSTATRLVTPTYTSPETPTVTAVDSGAGYILVTVTNPTPVGDEPQISGNDVYRRVHGTTTWTRIARIERGGSYRDYTAASGVSYDFKITAVV